MHSKIVLPIKRARRILRGNELRETKNSRKGLTVEACEESQLAGWLKTGQLVNRRRRKPLREGMLHQFIVLWPLRDKSPVDWPGTGVTWW